jgi:glucans biosynthesis protein
MPHSFDRRAFLRALALVTAGGALDPLSAVAADRDLIFGPPAPFSFEALKATARRRAGEPYAPPRLPAPEVVHRIDYDAWGKITFDTDHALFGDRRLPVTFFHLGRYFAKPVKIHAVADARSREVMYDASYFHIPPGSPARELPANSGFAGFRVQEPRDGALDWHKDDWVAFLGASYFRAIGELNQYGLSARAVAIDTAVFDKPEEFPDFTQVFIEEPAAGAATITVYALLEGPSLAGACRFVMTRDAAVTMDIDQSLFLRRPVSRLGLAPMTSMYWFSETVKTTAEDWRPEVHDSDGLAIWNGQGERIWRPLNNPARIAASAFEDVAPKGFGLLQRDRVFDHYLDGVFYDRRPSLWVEPKGDWGKGEIQLIELPVDDEIEDNIIVAWAPATQPAPGEEIKLAYRLHWRADEPYPMNLARCVATRLSRGGQPGQPRPPNVRKFLVEFLGGPLATLPFGVKPEMVVHASRGRLTDYSLIEPVPDGVAGHWRVQFDLADVKGPEPVDMRLQLVVGGKAASETWLYQYHPF